MRAMPGPLARIGRFHRDARLFLVTTAVAGAALSLYWIDFNLYLASLGFSPSTIGIVATIGSTAGAVVAFPASAASNRFGRRAMIATGMVVALIALGGLLLTQSLPLIIVSAALWSIGQQTMQVVQAPFLTEHSDPDQRNDLFAVQFAIQNGANVAAAILGAVGARAIASLIGLDPGGPGTYRVILVVMAVLLVAALSVVARLSDDRPAVVARRRQAALGDAAAPFPPDSARARGRFGLVVVDRPRFAKLVFPGFLIAMGAGQVIPFLNIYIQRKFGLDLTSLNAVFAVTSLGTVAAILAQPALARRFGQITSVVIVQVASIPFLVVLGFAPVIWLVIIAMAVRNSLMNAGNPIFSAFAMGQVSPTERATLAAAMTVLWQAGWVVGGAWYSAWQALVGFETGYVINFLTIITLYSIATSLYWRWFRRAEQRTRAARTAA